MNYLLKLIPISVLILCSAQSISLSQSRSKSTSQKQTKQEFKYDEKKYYPIIDSLKKSYNKLQLKSPSLKYEFVHITLTPLFCINQKLIAGDTLYLQNFKYTAYRGTKNSTGEYIQMCVCSYYQSKPYPTQKTFKIHTYYYNYNKNAWEDDQNPTTITLVLTDPATGSYGCKSTPAR